MFVFTELGSIQNRLLEIEEEKSRRLHNLREDYTGGIEDQLELSDILYLDTEKHILQIKRQFILDGFQMRIIFNILVPIVISVITAYIVTRIKMG